MIDSTTINFALSKFDSIAQKALPHLKEGSMALVDYKVLELVLETGVPVIITFICSLICTIFFIKYLKRSAKNDWEPELDFWLMTGNGLVGLFFLIGFICTSMDAAPLILALKHPVIYTILNLAGK